MVWTVAVCPAGLRNGAAQREEAGQEEGPAIKINPQHPWIWCTKTFSLVMKTSCSVPWQAAF